MIKEFKRGTEDEMYSNFYMKMQPLHHQGIAYATSEHLYMALKTTDVNARRSISNMAYPGHVKKWCSPKSGNIILRPGWDKMIKFQAMEYALRQKFSQPILAAKYIKDFPKELQEGNQWHDVCWGVDLRTGVGDNHLGKMHMHLRRELVNLPKGYDLTYGITDEMKAL